ncbi:MAG: hypothetical protein AB7F86_05365 [Bdellovibrionales bacterium]
MGKPTQDDWKKILVEYDRLLREGQGDHLRQKLTKIRLSTVPRPLLAEFARLFRRSNLWEQSLNVLKPIVYPKVKGGDSATPSERVEYVMALRRAGAFQEGFRILKHASLKENVRADLARAQLHMVQWDYEWALPLLTSVITRLDPTDYETQVARVNRLACMSFVGDAHFGNEYADLQRLLRESSSFLLLANVEEIAAHRLISDGDFDDAFARLKSAARLIQDDGGPYIGLIEKWMNIGKAVKKKSVKDLLDYRAFALKRADWETLRHLDFFVTRLQPDSIWADRVYYGTPYASFRAKLEGLRSFSDTGWICHSETSSLEFDPWFPGRDEGEYLHRLLVLLLNDWYRPLSMGGLFDGLYPGEHFDLGHSALRIRQHLLRLKKWLGKYQVPLRLFQAQGQYGLRTLVKAKIVCRKRSLSMDKSGFFFGRYVGQVKEDQDSADWQKLLGLTNRQTLYLLNQGISDGWISKVQNGRYANYRLTPPG